MTRGARRTVWLGGALLTLAAAVSQADEGVAAEAALPTRAERIHARALARRTATLAELMARFDGDRQGFIPLLSPDPDLLHRHGDGVLPFTAKGFPAEFVKGLVPAKGGGVARYPIRVFEDPRTRERSVLNAAGDEIARLPAPADYDPSAFAKKQFPKLFSKDVRSAARLLSIYDPARIVLDYELIAEEDLATWAAAEAAEAERLATKLDEPQMRPMEGGVRELAFVEIEPETGGGIRLGVAWAEGGLASNTFDFFACSDLVQAQWGIALTVTVDPQDLSFSWVADVQAARQFFDVWTHHDSDGDGIPDGRERRIYGTDPQNADSDGDGLTDYDELYVYGTNPLNSDSNGDGLPDGWKVALGLHPLAPVQTGEAGLRVWTPMRAAAE